MTVGYFMGIDPSLTGTGVCIMDANANICELQTLSAGKEKGLRRLEILRFQMLKVLARYPHIRGVALEGYSFGSTGAGTLSRAEWRGVLQWLLYDRGYAMYHLSPNSLKKFATGRGTGDKSAMVLAAWKNFKVDLSGRDDEADALWLAYAMKQVLFPIGAGPPLTLAQKDGLKSIERLESRHTRKRRR